MYAPGGPIGTSVDLNNVKAGDIIGFSGRGWQSIAINLGTYGLPFWSLSHVGIMGRSHEGDLLLFESTTLEDDWPCAITGRPINGTQAHTLAFVLSRYAGRAWHYPLHRPLYDAENGRLTRFLLSTIGLPYDGMGALRATGVGISWIESLFQPQDLSEIFCSEWVAAAYSHLGLCPDDNVSRWNPNRLCRRLRRRGIVLKPRRIK